jgi:murein DD-endopeptidase MepM/ murein hydrolase activator NlpD
MLFRYSLRFLFIGLVAGWFSACTGFGPTANLFRPNSPHEQYSQSLKTAKLDQTALGSDWLAAGERATRDSLTLSVPYRESGYFSASKAFAAGYRLEAQRGDRLLVKVETQGKKGIQVFIDVFALEDRNRISLVATSKADTNVLTWEPRKNQTYLIRIQPELLRSGSYTIDITREPALAFPVQGKTSKQIDSYFGADRDGGRRKHEGVDIFASKGTPAIASASGIITGVGTNSLGGNVAFVTDNERNIRIYYAHLDRWNVTEGQRVSVGDTVGFIGNTGNARTTGPHLHYGIYDIAGGAVNPLPFIRLGRGPAGQPLLPASQLGDSIRVATATTVIRLSPNSKSPVLRSLPKATAITTVGGTETWLRVELPDGLMGYIASQTVEPIERPLRNLVLANTSSLLDAAASGAARIKMLPTGTKVAVLATTGAFQLVRGNGGQTGWLSIHETAGVSAKTESTK